jgi:hypothetical protein
MAIVVEKPVEQEVNPEAEMPERTIVCIFFARDGYLGDNHLIT